MEEYLITEKKKQLQLIIVVVLSIFMFSIDYSMLNISLPTISGYFKISVGQVARLPLAYLLIVTSSLLAFGKLGDIKGYKKIFITGVSVLAVGTLLSSISPNINILLLSRMLQSLGEAMLSPVGLAILTTFLPTNLRGVALGIVAMTQGLGFAAGNIVGGFITSHFTWRYIFLLNIPIAVITILLAARALPKKQPGPENSRFDILGAILIFVTSSTFIYALNSLGKMKLTHPVILGCLGASLIGLVLFVLQEKRVSYPVLDLGLFKNKDFTFANAAAFSMICVLMGFIFLAPFYLETVRELPVMKSGALLMLPPLLMLILAPISGKLSDHIGSRILCSAGAFLGVISCTIFTLINKDSNLTLIVLSLLILGTAAGAFLAPNNKLVMAHASDDKQGVASGVYKTCLGIGSIFGIAIFPLIIMRAINIKAGYEHILMSEVRQHPGMIEAGFRSAFITGIFICAAAFLFSVFAKDKPAKQ